MINNIILILWYGAALLFPLGQIGSITPIPSVHIYFYEVLLILCTGIFIFTYRLKPFHNIRSLLLSIPVFFISLCVSLVLNAHRYSFHNNVVAVLYLLRLILYAMWIGYGVFHVRTSRSFIHHIRRTLLMLIPLIFLLSYGQYFLYPNLRNLYYLGWDPHEFRLFGLFFDLPIAGAVFGMLGIVIVQTKLVRRLVFRIGYIMLVLISILLTYARATYVATLAVVFVLIPSSKRLLLGLIFLACFIGALFLLPRPGGEGVHLLRVFSVESRLSDDMDAIHIWQKYPILGIGYNHIRPEKMALYPDDSGLADSHAGASFHSSFLMILVTGGMIGIVLFIMLLYTLIRRYPKTLPLIVFLSVLSFFDNVLLQGLVLYCAGVIVLYLIGLSDTLP